MKEMDQEKLIEHVRAYEALYVTSHPKYSDIRYKKNAWKEIGQKMKQQAGVCKKTWSNLRDSFRRAIKKKRLMKSGQPGRKINKWKFENQMYFLMPHLQERDPCANFGRDTDDEETRDDQDANNNEDMNNDSDNSSGDVKDEDSDDSSADEDTCNNRHARDGRKTRKKTINRRLARQTTGSRVIQNFASKPVIIKYVLGNRRNVNSQMRQRPNAEPDAIDTFFSSIASTVKSFSPYYQNIAKSRIFNIVTDIEMKQIMQSRQDQLELPIPSLQNLSHASIPATRTPEILESYHIAHCDIPQSPLSVSPSINASISPSPSHNFSCSVPTIDHTDRLVKKE